MELYRPGQTSSEHSGFWKRGVFDRRDCLEMVTCTGCDGVMLGRIAIAKPWIFAKWTRGRAAGPDAYYQSALSLSYLLEAHCDSTRAIRLFWRFAAYFSANFQFGHTLYSRIRGTDCMEDIRSIMNDFFAAEPPIVSRPNMNLFR